MSRDTDNQITLYTHRGGLNGWKVACLLSELGLAYESIYLDFSKQEQKSPEYLKLNPNGRIPAIIDHLNNDLVLWESNAILLYLVDTYDKEHKFSAATDTDKAFQNQWLSFQGSGQGVYFGQYFWFTFFHPEKVPSAVARYGKETERILDVLNDVLSKQEWLVGNKVTIADISFITWNHGVFAQREVLGMDLPIAETWPAVYRWHKALISRPAIKSVLDEMVALSN
ncbi:glutathione S-transferase [Calocera cornea HHB12733]|uniref:glutathione transferase n=1 Tax=Calocera cornea HHB12733 TaxID=1353952 RepID=A0A165H1M3_9BASI|nr:glutathione S-transferase [Calocera cornea HHB12733]